MTSKLKHAAAFCEWHPGASFTAVSHVLRLPSSSHTSAGLSSHAATLSVVSSNCQSAFAAVAQSDSSESSMHTVRFASVTVLQVLVLTTSCRESRPQVKQGGSASSSVSLLCWPDWSSAPTDSAWLPHSNPHPAQHAVPAQLTSDTWCVSYSPSLTNITDICCMTAR